MITKSNHVLTSLLPRDLRALQPHLESVKLRVMEKIEIPDQAIEYVYFPTDGIISVVANSRRGRGVEVGLIGWDGATAQAVMMGATRSTNASFVQVAGHGQRMKADVMRRAMRESESLSDSLLLVVQTFVMQASNTAMANGLANIEQRLARWLLMADDRVVGDNIVLTHEILAVMLGVRRSGVTVALQGLVTRKLISSRRNTLSIVDRHRLLKFAQDFYGPLQLEHKRLNGWASVKGAEA